jgi:hypothetical protein
MLLCNLDERLKEGLGKITIEILEQLSVQQIIDCDLNSGNNGYYGGYASTLYKYVVMEFGLTIESLLWCNHKSVWPSLST